MNQTAITEDHLGHPCVFAYDGAIRIGKLVKITRSLDPPKFPDANEELVDEIFTVRYEDGGGDLVRINFTDETCLIPLDKDVYWHTTQAHNIFKRLVQMDGTAREMIENHITTDEPVFTTGELIDAECN